MLLAFLDTKRRAGLSKNTLKLLRSALSSLFTDALGAGDLAVHPFAGVSWATPGTDIRITWTIADDTVRCRVRGPFSGYLLDSLVQGFNNGATSGPVTGPTDGRCRARTERASGTSSPWSSRS
jgi:hypothetical protein